MLLPDMGQLHLYQLQLNYNYNCNWPISGYYAWFVSLHNLQCVLHSFKVTHPQFANFSHKPDANCSQIVQCILEIVQTCKLHATILLA